MPAVAPVVENVSHWICVFGVAGVGEKVIGARVPSVNGLLASPGSAKDVVSTVPVNAAFLLTVILTWVSRFWVVPMFTWDGVASVKSGMVITVPEYTPHRISSPATYRAAIESITVPELLPSMIPTWSFTSGGVVAGGKFGPG